MDYQDIDSPEKKRSQKMPSEVDLTALYLREVGSTPLLDREQEAELAGRLQQSRRDFAKAVGRLPAACRDAVTVPRKKGKSSGKGLWSMRRIEATHELLEGYAREFPEIRRNKAHLAVRDAKRRMDRARDAMIEANLRLVAHVAKKFGGQGLPYMDLVQEGNIGLMKAVEKFEHERGYKFSTYAFWWIKQAITRAISDKSRTIRIPVHLVEKMRKVQRAGRELEDELGREPSPQEVADRLQLPLKAVTEILGPGQDD